MPRLLIMYCVNPINIEEKGTFPCGMCRFCREMRSNQWALRMMHESNYWDACSFITLTYNDQNLPKDGNLQKEALQLFVKRVRKYIEPRICKYFGCGEYGEKRGRPHYHIVFFGLGAKDKKVIEDCWKFGFIYVEPLTRQTARYVTKYVTKAPLGRSKRDKYYCTRVPEFQTASHGIGLRWIMENFETVGKRGISYHGRSISLPRYYVIKGKEAGMSDQLLEDVRAERVQESMLRTIALINKGLSGEDVRRIHEAERDQRIEEVKTRNEQFRHVDKHGQ